MTNIVSPDSLIGMALADAEAAHWEASYDADGYQDTLEADHQMDQYGYLERLVAEQADVLAVFAEEATRWS
jgi:hypothetical protein